MKTLVLAALLLTTAARAAEEDGCSRDTDCKSQRICVQRQCVWPGEQPSDVAPPSGTEVTSPQPPPPPPPGYYPESPRSEPPRSPPPYRRPPADRHRGLFLRLDIGGGYLASGYSQDATDFSIAGGAIATSFALGGTVGRNQALAFHFWVMAVGNPNVRVNGNDVGTLDNTTLTLFGMGPEYNIYSQQNWYFSVTPSLTRLHIDANGSSSGSSGDTNWGFGVRLAVGKEWWVGDKWGLGAAAQFTFSSNTDQGGNAPTLNSFGGALAFSATWN